MVAQVMAKKAKKFWSSSLALMIPNSPQEAPSPGR